MNITDSFRGAMRRLGERVFASNTNSNIKRRTVPLSSILNTHSVRADALPKPTPANLRRFAETPIARKAINTIKDRVAGMGWRIQPRHGKSLEELPGASERVALL